MNGENQPLGADEPVEVQGLEEFVGYTSIS